MEFKIRKADKDDALKMNFLLTRLIQDEKQYDESIDENFIVVSFYERYVDDDKKCLLVATNEETIMGYLYGYLKEDDGTTENVLVAKLDALYVEEEYRKNGIAQELISYFKNWCEDKDVHALEVDVCSENIKAFNLYKGIGFKEIKKTMKMEI